LIEGKGKKRKRERRKIGCRKRVLFDGRHTVTAAGKRGGEKGGKTGERPGFAERRREKEKELS